MNQEFQAKFPFLTEPEREVLYLLTLSKQEKTEGFEKLKGVFLEMVKKWSLDCLKWSTTPAEKIELRRKLLNVAGIWSLIPFADIQKALEEIDPFNKKPITDVKIQSIYQEDVEIPSHDLKLVDSMAGLLASISYDDEGLNYLDFVSGNRDKYQHPASSVTVFKKNLRGDVLSDAYLTASAEVFTKTILITTFDERGERRDLVSIAFDLVLESAYLDSYHNWTGDFVPELILRNTKVAGCDFLSKVVDKLEAHLAGGKRVMELYEIFPDNLPFMGFESWEKIYLDLLKNRILKKHVADIEALNKKLGLVQGQGSN